MLGFVFSCQGKPVCCLLERQPPLAFFPPHCLENLFIYLSESPSCRKAGRNAGRERDFFISFPVQMAAMAELGREFHFSVPHGW